MERPRLRSVVIAIVILASAAFASPVRLRCEYLQNPLGIAVALAFCNAKRRVFSWRALQVWTV